MTIEKARDILRHRFGYDAFRLNQEAAIESILSGHDCVVLMPTGGGKSLCYQIPALVLDGLTVVISPLIALMKDQVDALRANGVAAAFLNSTQSAAEQVPVFQKVRSGELKLLYVAPERLLKSDDRFIDFLRGVSVSLFAIDEAHCISSWGHDFRPEYLRLAALKREFPAVPLIALTATADKLVRKDIVDRLEIKNAEVFVSSFNRLNIHYAVKPKRDSYGKLLRFLDKRKDQSGIIYCLSRNSVNSLAADLRDEGFSALAYHAGLDKQTRDRHQTSFLNDETKIIVATIAFGMGIDKSNVRFVVHMDLPKNIESYYQETGRAGRDGLESEALLFYSYADVSKLKGFVEVDGNVDQSAIMLKKLDAMAKYGDLKSCRRKFLLNYFSEGFDQSCGNCDNCTGKFERFDGTVIAQKALSAVYRTGQRFGMSYVIDLLRGSQAQTIREEHKNLKTYGVGADLPKQVWFDHFKDLIAQGYLLQAEGTYPVIKLTEKSADVLSGKTIVELIKIKVKEEKKPKLVAEVSLPYIHGLFNELRDVRTAFARNEKVPPYVIFSDATLIEMATYLPQSEWEMRKISGVGDLKMEKYGAEFLRWIKDYCLVKKLTSRIDLRSPKRKNNRRTKRDATGKDTYRISFEMFREGRSIAEIAQQRDIQPSTVENHLASFIATGEIQLHELVAPHKVETIRNAVLKFNETGALSPIKEFLGDEYTYGEIRAVIASMQ
jgi:ATP-dependent DNA helicase RecQ